MNLGKHVLMDCPRCGVELKAPLVADGPFKDEDGKSYIDIKVDITDIRHRCSKKRPKGKPTSPRPRSKTKRA